MGDARLPLAVLALCAATGCMDQYDSFEMDGYQRFEFGADPSAEIDSLVEEFGRAAFSESQGFSRRFYKLSDQEAVGIVQARISEGARLRVEGRIQFRSRDGEVWSVDAAGVKWMCRNSGSREWTITPCP